MNHFAEHWQRIALGLGLLSLIALLGPTSPQWRSPLSPATARAQTAIAPSTHSLQQFQVAIGNIAVSVSVVEIDPHQPDFKLRPFWSSPAQIPGLLDTQSAARQAGAAIAINGGFFSRITHQPLGALRLNGEWVSSPILGRGVMAWSDRGEFLFTRAHFRERVTTSGGTQFELVDLNSGYFRAGLARYTPIWGRDYSTETDREVILSVASDRIVNRQTADLAGSLSVPIPRRGYLLVARQTEAADLARQLSIGETLWVETRIEPADLDRFPHALGAGPLLLKSGRIVLDAELEQFRPPFPTQRAARSAVGYTANGKLLFVTAGKGEEETGITLSEMARLMQQLGSRDALNLDGGTSSTLYAGDRIVNFTGRPPRVHNSLGWFD
ncbi:phosphodiester glycosidase family protein [Synechococcus sp. PCC 7336]|uniref:phosphodiester glycosidase family protein n=1 Tax=Synechococcus sp. PCC 7336 TaxID=195250 RepID=UPI0003449A38|nr:phosphodiester glycosidase family protein [Synechococcus sp. PCC 7336]